jgi:hypothetical protein
MTSAMHKRFIKFIDPKDSLPSSLGSANDPILNHMNPVNTFPFYFFQVLGKIITKIGSSVNVIQAHKVVNI